MEISDTGIYFDNESKQIVNEPPVHGVQIVAPGGEVTANAQRDVDAYRAQFPTVEQSVTDPEPEVDAVKAPAAKVRK